MTARVRTTPQSRAQALDADTWWRGNRPAARDLFGQELEGALAHLAETPDLGKRHRRRGFPGLRRMLLPGTRYHVYYVHDEEAGEVVVLAVWSAVRGRGPRLDRP